MKDLFKQALENEEFNNWWTEMFRRYVIEDCNKKGRFSAVVSEITKLILVDDISRLSSLFLPIPLEEIKKSRKDFLENRVYGDAHFSALILFDKYREDCIGWFIGIKTAGIEVFKADKGEDCLNFFNIDEEEYLEKVLTSRLREMNSLFSWFDAAAVAKAAMKKIAKANEHKKLLDFAKNALVG